MLTVMIAFRNLLRNRRRSLTTLVAMVIGAQAILIFGGFSTDIARGLETGYVQLSGHFQIQHKGYFLFGASNPGAYGITDYMDIITRLRQDKVLEPMLRMATPTLSLAGVAGNFSAGASKPVFANGVIVEDMSRMRDWNDYGFNIPHRPLALLNTPDDAAVIGIGVARMLQLCGPLKVPDCPAAPDAAPVQGAALPQDVAAIAAEETPATGTTADNVPRIELLAATTHGAPNVTRLRVVKAARQGTKESDDMAVSLHLDAAQRLVYGDEHGGVTAILVQLVHSAQMPEARARLETLLRAMPTAEPLEVLDFRALNPFYGQVIAMFDTILGFIASLIAVIVMFTVGNTMNMAIMERTVEIGTLRALGIRRASVRRMFVFEGLMLGAAGSVAGVLIALLLAALVNHSGIGWMPPGGTDKIPIKVRIWGQTDMLLLTFFGMLAVSAFSAWWPARRAAMMPIVDALRHA